LSHRRRLAGHAICETPAMIGVVDIGGTKLLAGVSEDGTTVQNVVHRPTGKDSGAEQLRSMLAEAAGGKKLDAITMSVPGPFRRRPPSLVNPPGMPKAWWELDFQSTLGKEFDCRVVVENDANC